MVVIANTVATPPPVSKVKSFFQKYFTKTALIAGLVIIASVGIYIAYNQHSKLTQARAELTVTTSLKDIVEKEKNRLDSLARVYVLSIKDRDAVIVEKDKKAALQLSTISALKDTLKHTLTDLTAVTSDSSYKYINARVPAIAVQKYPFDSIQVKTIHYTFLERDGLFGINANQNILISNLQQISTVKDSQITDLKNLGNIYLSKENICQKENTAYKTQITGLDKTIKQQKLLKTISNSALIGAGAYILIHALVK